MAGRIRERRNGPAIKLKGPSESLEEGSNGERPTTPTLAPSQGALIPAAPYFKGQMDDPFGMVMVGALPGKHPHRVTGGTQPWRLCRGRRSFSIGSFFGPFEARRGGGPGATCATRHSQWGPSFSAAAPANPRGGAGPTGHGTVKEPGRRPVTGPGGVGRGCGAGLRCIPSGGRSAAKYCPVNTQRPCLERGAPSVSVERAQGERGCEGGEK